MKAIKNVNNNVCICLDSKGAEVIVFGKGIGFKKPPFEIELSQIQKTFYEVSPLNVQMIEHIPQEMIELSIQIMDYATTKLNYALNSNIVFTLADHLAFAIQRKKKNMKVDMPIYYDIKSLYEKEYDIGDYAVKLIVQKCKVELPKSEIAGVAIHLINAAAITQEEEKIDNNFVIEHIKELIEETMNIRIYENDFNYSRFVTHLQYLLKRGEQGESIDSDNYQLFESLKNGFPNVYQCSVKINEYLTSIYDFSFDKEELLYLMLHINRLCTREEFK
ncbi:beta-glucoside operon transcriptional antiterminator [Enterococcus sp. AZ135]|uniref:PRD domain-containing protein n=1 Tax=unclassified Enterococcus TaxID=2608891 RepID=UPI003F2859E8